MSRPPEGLAPITVIVGAILVAVAAAMQIGVADSLTDQGGGSDEGAVFLSYILSGVGTAGAFVFAVGIVVALWRAATKVDGA